MFAIREDDLTGAATRALLALHLAGMRADTPPGAVFALDLSGLRDPSVTVWTAWDGDAIAGIAALRVMPDGGGEVKSMRTHPDHLRRGVAGLLLDHLIDAARARDLARLSLETGRGPAFAAAFAFYVAHGFVEGGAFGGYTEGGFSRFLHRDI